MVLVFKLVLVETIKPLFDWSCKNPTNLIMRGTILFFLFECIACLSYLTPVKEISEADWNQKVKEIASGSPECCIKEEKLEIDELSAPVVTSSNLQPKSSNTPLSHPKVQKLKESNAIKQEENNEEATAVTVL